MAVASGARRNVKSDAAFRTISEVSQELDVPAHVLRFWETKFDAIRPMKRGGNRRYYRPEDLLVLRQVRDLLYSQGYTIKGAQQVLRRSGGRSGPRLAASNETGSAASATKAKGAAASQAALRAVLRELHDIRDELDAAVRKAAAGREEQG